MPFDLGDDLTGLVPACCPVAEAGLVPANLDGRAAEGALEQVADALLKHAVGGKPNRVFVVLSLQELIDLGVRKRGVGAEVSPLETAR